MTCRELADFLVDYLEGSLPEAQRGAFERHLALCPTCVAYLDSYRKTVALASETGDRPCPPPMPEGLVRAILDAAKRA